MSATNNPQRSHHVGIDVSKERLDVCLMPEGEAFAVANDQEGIDSLIEHLQGVRPELVVESTHRSSLPSPELSVLRPASCPTRKLSPCRLCCPGGANSRRYEHRRE